MLSADDAEYPREYRTLGGGSGAGGGGRRFSNVGLVHTSERRHTVIAAQSLEALSGLQKADADRKRDAFMDHLKNKYPQHALALRGQPDRMREQVSGGPPLWAGEGSGPVLPCPRGSVSVRHQRRELERGWRDFSGAWGGSGWGLSLQTSVCSPAVGSTGWSRGAEGRRTGLRRGKFVSAAKEVVGRGRGQSWGLAVRSLKIHPSWS